MILLNIWDKSALLLLLDKFLSFHHKFNFNLNFMKIKLIKIQIINNNFIIYEN